MRLSLLLVTLTTLAALAIAEEAAAPATPAETTAAAATAGSEAPTDDAVEEAAFEPNTIAQKHIGGDVLVLSVL